ncbi:MAG: ABC transporter permease [Labilithrix sp.]|nr:ABC transporter permease [Labilithrix sp.]MCW5811661.1 ABC transporter permease [Labilithrix sp.]
MKRPHVAVLVLVLWGQAARALFRNKGRSLLTSVGIAVAIAAVAWVVALGDESRARYTLLLHNLGDNLVWVEAGGRNIAGVRTGSKTTTTLTVADMEAIVREVPLIERSSPQVDAQVQIVSERSNWRTYARGVARDYLPIKRWEITAGSVFTEDDVTQARNVILIGETVRKQLFGADDPIGAIVRVNGQVYEVIGLLKPKGQSASGSDMDDTVMVPYTTALTKLRPPGSAYIDDIVSSAVSPEAVVPATNAIVALMRERHRIAEGMDDDFNIRHPEDIVKAQLEASETFANLITAVALIALLVGGIGVMNVMLASVSERTREIGVRLAHGATEFAILLQFLTESVLLAAFGGALGIGLSVLGASAIGHAVGWSLAIPADAVVLAMGVSAAVGVLFGFVPARRAARLDPIVALRAE